MTRRLYLANVAPTYTPPTKRGDWTTSASASIGLLNPTRPNINGVSSSINQSAAGTFVLTRRFVSPPTAYSGTISGATANWVIGQGRNSGATESTHIYAYVTAGDTDTERGVLIDNVDGGSIPATPAGVAGSTSLGTVAYSAGDRIVVNVGFHTTAGSGALNNPTYYGGVGTDLVDGSTAVTTDPGWIEFVGMDHFWTGAINAAAPALTGSWSTGHDSSTDPKTVTATTAVGDTVVVLGAFEEDIDTSNTGLTMSGTLTWTERKDQGPAGNYGRLGIWSAPGIAASNFSISGANDASGTTYWWGYTALRFTGSDGVGACEAASNTNANPSVSITTQAANSALAVVIVNWAATDNSGYVWRAVNGYRPSVLNGGVQTYYNHTSHFTVYVAYYPDAGAAGAQLVGLETAANGGTETMGGHSVAVVEVLGAATPPEPPVAGDRSGLLPGVPYQIGNQSVGGAPPPYDRRRSSFLTFV